MDEKDISRITPVMNSLLGFNIGNYSNSFLIRRFESRLLRLKLNSIDEYIEYIKDNEEEIGRFKHELSINVTNFFRDKSMYEAFMLEPLFNLIKQKDEAKERNLRVWSAGCATGEEPYSIAITFLELLGQRINDFDLKIIASDLDVEAIRKAREGIYEQIRLKETDPNILNNYFRKEEGLFHLKEDLKKYVVFRQQDILSPFKPRNLDVLFCRNVVIYFSRDIKEKLFEEFCSSLRQKGLLILGKTETLIGSAIDKFELVNIAERIYVKK